MYGTALMILVMSLHIDCYVLPIGIDPPTADSANQFSSIWCLSHCTEKFTQKVPTCQVRQIRTKVVLHNNDWLHKRFNDSDIARHATTNEIAHTGEPTCM